MLFDGIEMLPGSSPLSYDMVTRKFTIYSEDFSLLGMHEISIIGYFRNFPSVENSLPHPTAPIEFLDPCLRPASIQSPIQIRPEPYLYTTSGATVSVMPMIVDPPMCLVDYECISVTGGDPDMKCEMFRKN